MSRLAEEGGGDGVRAQVSIRPTMVAIEEPLASDGGESDPSSNVSAHNAPSSPALRAHRAARPHRQPRSDLCRIFGDDKRLARQSRSKYSHRGSLPTCLYRVSPLTMSARCRVRFGTDAESIDDGLSITR